MPAVPIPSQKVELLALAVATGGTVKAWADENRVVERTARRWAATPEFKARVHELRDALIDRALGKLADHASAAVDVLANLLGSKEERVRLAAAKEIVNMLVSVRGEVELAARVAALEGTAHGQHPEPDRGAGSPLA